VKISNILDVFINWQVLLLSFGVFAILGTIRAVGTKRDPKTNEAIGGFAEWTWFKRFLPIYPYILSLALVCIPGIPLPAIVTTKIVRFLYGVYAGWLTDKVYQVIKNYLDERGIHLEQVASRSQTVYAEKAEEPKNPTP
jgi:hypothetical protein